jgi:hypothetical protein
VKDDTDYTVTAEWPGGRKGYTSAEDIETAELFKEFCEASGAERVEITPPDIEL